MRFFTNGSLQMVITGSKSGAPYFAHYYSLRLKIKTTGSTPSRSVCGAPFSFNPGWQEHSGILNCGEHEDNYEEVMNSENGQKDTLKPYAEVMNMNNTERAAL
jgi:hypothetical protein